MGWIPDGVDPEWEGSQVAGSRMGGADSQQAHRGWMVGPGGYPRVVGCRPHLVWPLEKKSAARVCSRRHYLQHSTSPLGDVGMDGGAVLSAAADLQPITTRSDGRVLHLRPDTAQSTVRGCHVALGGTWPIQEKGRGARGHASNHEPDG